MVEKKVFFQALLMTLLLFGAGLLIGLFIEGFKSDNAEVALLNSEVRVLDEQLRIQAIGNSNVTCDFAKNSTFQFADEIYGDAKLLEEYDSSKKFKDTFLVLSKRYALLRFLLLNEITNVNNNCGSSFHTIVYLYEYNNEDSFKQAKQNYFSKYLAELKAKYPSKVLLLPIAVDLDLSSVDILLNQYNINVFPAVILDESNVIYSNDEVKGLDEIINKSFNPIIVQNSSLNISLNNSF